MKADNINDTTLTRKPRPVGGELYLLRPPMNWLKNLKKISNLKEITGKQRYKKFSFASYIEIIAKGTRNNF